MLNVNPSQTREVVSSVQRDYRVAAEQYRLSKVSGPQSHKSRMRKNGVAIVTLITSILAISQFLI